MILIENLKQAIIDGDEVLTIQIVKEIIEKKFDVHQVLFEGLCEGMKEVGRLYEEHEYFIPEIIISADAFNAGFEIIKPYLEQMEEKPKATVVIGVVKGDIHDIGKNIVAQFLIANGYKVIDLGRNVHSDLFIENTKQNEADVVCLSTLMSPTLEEMKVVVEKLKERNLKDKIKVVIGGATTDPDFMKEIGADYCCKDAYEVVHILDNLFLKRSE